jgi:ATP/maltotriose-dependent transcriptional regulator MalT
MLAVHHSMRAGDTEDAFARLEAYAASTWSLEDQATGRETVRAWLQEHGASYVERSPRGVLACAILLNVIGQGDDAEPWLRRVDAREPELEHTSRFLLHGAWGFDRLQHGDPAAALDRARRAQAVLREGPVHSPWAQAIPSVLVQAHLWLDDLDGAEATLESAEIDPAFPVPAGVRLPGFASQVQVRRGELSEAEHLALSALAAADDLGLEDGNFGRAEPHLALAAIAFERDQLDDAEAHVDQVMRIAEGGRRPPLELLAHLKLALLAGARGDQHRADDAVEEARTVLPQATSPVIARIDQVQLRLALGRGDAETAAVMAGRLPPSPMSALLAARVHLAADNPRAAYEVLTAMAGEAGSTRRIEIEHSLLNALTLAKTGLARPDAALYRALELAEPVGFHRTFVAEGPALWKLLASLPAHGRIADYVAELLASTQRVVPPPKPGTPQTLVDPLSDRELTVLRYLASRLTCTEIARELYLSVNTVRSHVKAIYRKLGVNSRADAVARARALGLA